MSRSKKVQGLCDLSFLKICKLSVVQFSRSALSRWQLIYFSTLILLCQHFFQIFFRSVLVPTEVFLIVLRFFELSGISFPGCSPERLIILSYPFLLVNSFFDFFRIKLFHLQILILILRFACLRFQHSIPWFYFPLVHNFYCSIFAKML